MRLGPSVIGPSTFLLIVSGPRHRQAVRPDRRAKAHRRNPRSRPAFRNAPARQSTVGSLIVERAVELPPFSPAILASLRHNDVSGRLPLVYWAAHAHAALDSLGRNVRLGR